MSTNDDNRTLALMVAITESRPMWEGDKPFFHITVTPVRYSAREDKVWNLSVTSYHDTERALAGLEISAQSDADHARDGRGMYGYKVGYGNVHFVELDGIKVMAATLTRINRKLDKLTSTYGHPTTFAQFVLRVADALGITMFVTERSKTMLPSGFYHKTMSATDAEYRMNDSEREFVNKHNRREQQETA